MFAHRQLLPILALVAFPYVVAASTLNTIVSFTGANGRTPLARLFQGSDGNFYGTTYNGGASDGGTVFKLTPGGALTTLVNFNGTNGGGPEGGLIQVGGDLYGTSSSTVFKITSGGTFSTLATLPAGDASFAGLTLGKDGNFYGTSYWGGTLQSGYIFQITPGGTLTTSANFSGANGTGPNIGGLILGSDGNFYGTTEGGGASGYYGTIFKFSGGNTLNALASFNRANGANPAGVIQASDGNFYGTTKAGGTSLYGTIFKLTPDGTLTTLVNFTDGIYPQAGLIQGKDGYFYGTTASGGTSGRGTLFQLIIMPGPAPMLTKMVDFNSTNGASPQATLIQASDGYFYGTTSGGGTAQDGTIFRCNTGTTEAVAFNSATTIPFTTSAYTIRGSALNVTLNYAPALGDVLTVVRNTGGAPIDGTFINLPNGGTITANFNSTAYKFLANYSGGSGSDLTLTYKPIATLNLGNLAVTYDGAPKAVTATTNPSGLNVTFSYGGTSTAPTKAGSYAVVGTINDPTYVGIATGTLVVGKATASVTLGNLAAIYDGTPKPVTATTSPPALNVAYTYYGVSTPYYDVTPPIAVGTYSVVGTINDSNYTGSAVGTLVISNSTFTQWTAKYGLTGNQALLMAIVSPDGITNQTKYALGLNPFTTYNPGSASLPLVKMKDVGGTQYLTLTFTGVATDVTYTVQATNDLLGIWSPIYSYKGVPPPGTVTVQDPHAVSEFSTRYLRLQVTP